jgi:hypothetical protein
VTTASIRPELVPEQLARSKSRVWVVAALALLLLWGCGFRVYQLGAEGLSEDELNKVRAAAEYRERGLTSANGEHPLLMKALLTGSIVLAERWNSTQTARSNPQLQMQVETAARLPAALFGALTTLLIFLVASELFGTSIGLTAAALWAFDPQAIGFNRIAKEDTFLLFFFLLANVFWLRGQRAAEEGRAHAERFYWATAASFGAMMASKYMPHFLAISGSYYYIFQGMAATKWRMGKVRWLIFFVVMGAVFLLCNPTILLPDTWREMKIFAGERRIGHDSYEFMGELYRNQMTLWLKGSPWYFYYVFMGVKLPLLSLAAFLVGLPLLFTRRLGDGRFFILFWLFYWFFPFTFLGGKFTRYFTLALPVVLITSAIGLHAVARILAPLVERLSTSERLKSTLRAAPAFVAVALAAYASASAAPNFRLYTNALGGGMTRAGSYFPHDEFYDSSIRETVRAMLPRARTGARVASETPELVAYYARQQGRDGLVSVSLSDAAAMREFKEGDIVLVARGRRYFSNERTVAALRRVSAPALSVALGQVPAAEVFVLDSAGARAVSQP